MGHFHTHTPCEVCHGPSFEIAHTESPAELINLVRHMRTYKDGLGSALRNVFDFDVYKPDTVDKLAQILVHHG